MSTVKSNMCEVLLGKYQILDTIGHGTFGEVKRARNLETDQEIAIKFERLSEETRSLLFNEAETLSQLQGGVGIPKLYAFGKLEDRDFMVTELLGNNLLTLFKTCGRTFHLETIARLAVQMIERLEFVHNRGYLHRDLKPENLLIDRKARDIVYLSDFGLAKKYVNTEFGMHIPFKKDKSFTGTLTYASLNMHMGLQQSRRDDLQSVFFVLLFFLRGRLPWQKSSQPQGKALMQKLLLTPNELFDGFPPQFATAGTYIRGLAFEEQPDYAYLRGLFTALSDSLQVFDWLDVEATKRRRRRAHTNSVRSRLLASDHMARATAHTGEMPQAVRRDFVATDNNAPPRKMVTFSQEGEKDSDEEEDTIKGSRLPSFDREKLREKIRIAVP